jgi:hypothetical protein
MATSLDIEKLVTPQISLTGPPLPGPSWSAGCRSFLKSATASAEVLSLRLAALDDPELVAKLAPYEKNFAKLRGFLQLGDLGIKTLGLAILLGVVSGSGVTPSILLVAVVLATYLVAVDRITFVRAPLLDAGLRAMADAGMQVKLPSRGRRSAKFAKALRFVMTIVTGVLFALVLGLKYDSSAILQQERLDFLSNNRSLYEQATHDYDGKKQRAEEAVREQLAVVNGKRNVSAQRREQQAAELNRRQRTLEQLNIGRSEMIEQWIEKQPNFIPGDASSFIGRIRAFFEFLWANPAAALPVLALDAVVLALDLMTATLSSIGIPSLYAAEMLRRQLESIVRTTRATAANLKPAEERASSDGDDPPPPASPAAGAAAPPRPPQPPSPGANGAAMPQRGRGRPRKNETAPPAPNVPRAA